MVTQAPGLQRRHMLRVKGLDENVVIRLSPLDRERDREAERRAERIWLEELGSGNDSVFNDLILSCTGVAGSRIHCTRVEYKYFFAQTKHPELFDKLRIRPVAVSGLLRCADGIVVGKRSQETSQDAGRWELVPSGGIDASAVTLDSIVDHRTQLLTEFEEETGLGVEPVESVEPLCLVYDDESKVLDIGSVIRTSVGFDTILNAYHALEYREYEEIRVIDEDAVEDFFDRDDIEFVNVSKIMLQFYLGNHL
ncbi:hypothetical protein ACFL1S_03540 [Pseudomonadota bacterium]